MTSDGRRRVFDDGTQVDLSLSDLSGGGLHASSHASAGSDPVTLAQSQITGLVSALAGKETAGAAATAYAAAAADLAAHAAASDPHPTYTTAAELASALSGYQAADADLTTLAGAGLPVPIAQGGTGQATQTAAMDALSPTTTKGDLLVDNGTNVVRVAAGTNGHQLCADSAQTEGVRWARKAMFDWCVNGRIDAALTWTDMPSAANFLSASAIHRTRLDLTEFTQCRIVVTMGPTAGASGAKLTVKYKATSDTTTFASVSDIGTSEVNCLIDSASTCVAGSWVDLAAGAKADVFVYVGGRDGNGTTDPTFASIHVQFR